MSEPESNPKPPRHKFRWYQFSLRSLFVFVTLCAFACSWFAVKMRAAERQRDAVKALKRFPCDIQYDYKKARRQPGPAWLCRLLGNDFFASVEFVCPEGEFTDADVARLEAFPKLKGLLLCSGGVTDAELKHLAGLTRLRVLYLAGNPITDAGLKQLEGLVELDELSLDDTRVTDQGVRKLQEALPKCHITN